jgi:hypothetical protein
MASAAASSGEAAAARRGRTPASSSAAGSEGHRQGRRTASAARHAGSGDAARVVTQRQNSARFLRSPGLLRSAVRCAPRSHSVLRCRLWTGRTPGTGPGTQVQSASAESGPASGAGAGPGTSRRSLTDHQRWAMETLPRSRGTLAGARPHLFDAGRPGPIFSRPNCASRHS